jgi:hypothetical protein
MKEREFEVSMTRKLIFFLGLQIKQSEKGILIYQEKYTKNLLRKYKMDETKPINTPMHPFSYLDKDDKVKSLSKKIYR